MLSFFFVSDSLSLSKEQAQRFITKLKFLKAQRPPYECKITIAPFDPIEKGVDCSRMVFLAGAWSGWQVDRVTAEDMSLGLGGWIGENITLDEADEGDIPFWRWKKFVGPGPMKHTGVFIIGDLSKLIEVMHASATRGTIVQEELKGVMIEDLKKIRRLTIGDPKK
jgi:hypothetical protein